MIVVNLDIMMARRKMSLGRVGRKDWYYPCQPLHSENRKGESHPFLHPRGNLPDIGLSAGGYSGISGGGMNFSVNFCSDSDTFVSNRQRNKNNL